MSNIVLFSICVRFYRARISRCANQATGFIDRMPEIPQDLTQHNCINLRLPTHDSRYAWEFAREGRALEVQVQGQLVFNLNSLRLNAALAGLGLAHVPEDGASLS